jgi:hypothetical protein
MAVKACTASLPGRPACFFRALLRMTAASNKVNQLEEVSASLHMQHCESLTRRERSAAP